MMVLPNCFKTFITVREINQTSPFLSLMNELVKVVVGGVFFSWIIFLIMPRICKRKPSLSGPILETDIYVVQSTPIQAYYRRIDRLAQRKE